MRTPRPSAKAPATPAVRSAAPDAARPASAKRREIEINAAAERREEALEFRQHLINASNELYLHQMLCAQHGHAFPASLKRAYSAVRAELKRLEAAARSEREA
jgi:hypothetical protein